MLNLSALDFPATSWVNLALQVPLALVIVFLVIRFLGFIKEMVQAFLAALKSQDENNRKFIEDQTNQNREFIKEQQNHTNAAISRLAEEIKSNKTDMLKELSNLTQRVDGVLDKAFIIEQLTESKRERNKT